MVVGDHQRRGAGRVQDVAQVGREPFAQTGVERRERLVEQQQPRLGRQRAGQRDPLALAAGEGGGQPVAVPRQADQLEQLGHPGRRVRGPAQAQRVADVAGHGQVSEQLAVLEQQREAALVGGYAGQVGAVPAHAARGERLEPGDGTQQRGLAAARRSEHGQHLPVGQLEVDVRHGRYPVVGHRDVVQRQHQ